MAHFRGVLDTGASTVTSRLSNGAVPFTTLAQSYEGEVEVRMWRSREGVDMVEVTARNHKTDHLNRWSRVIYSGAVRDIRETK